METILLDASVCSSFLRRHSTHLQIGMPVKQSRRRPTSKWTHVLKEVSRMSLVLCFFLICCNYQYRKSYWFAERPSKSEVGLEVNLEEGQTFLVLFFQPSTIMANFTLPNVTQTQQTWHKIYCTRCSGWAEGKGVPHGPIGSVLGWKWDTHSYFSGSPVLSR